MQLQPITCYHMLLNEPCLELHLNQTWLQIYIERNRNQLHGKFETNNETNNRQASINCGTKNLLSFDIYL